MTRKLRNITEKISPAVALILIAAVWAVISGFELVPSYMLPSPVSVVKALIEDFSLLMEHAATTLTEAGIGLGIGIILAFITASLMDRFRLLYNAVYPLLIITQTIPTVAIAPILIMWMGFDMAPKIALIVITTFFPITVGLLDGYASVDPDAVSLLRSMGAGNLRIFFTVKIPSALSHFFAGLKISASYAVVGGVIAEWLGGFEGLGVYMTRVRKAYQFDKMFAVILLIIIISLLLMLAVSLVRKAVMPWERKGVLKKMKKIIAILLSAVILFSFAGCAGNLNNEETSTDDADTSSELTKITFALDWTPNTNHTGLYVAKEKGYFEEAGLDVDIVYVADSSSTTLCATGKAQFAIEAQDTMAAAFTSDSPLGITAVAAILQHNSSGIISRKGEGIDTPKGLAGKTYSTWDSPVELAMLETVVEADGGNFDDVTLIPNTITDEPGALAAKQTDAIWVFYGWGGINADVQGFEYDFFFFKDIDEVFDYYTPVIIGNNDYMSENPEITKAFLAAVKKGYEYAAENPDESAQILIDSDNTGSLKGSEELVKKSQAWISTQYISDAESWGVIDAERWNAFYNWLNDNDLVAKKIPEGTGFTNEYLN